MVAWRRKNSKLRWLKRPRTVSNYRNLDKKINSSKPHIWSLSFNFRFFNRKTQSQQKLAKKITHFTTQFHSKNLIYFTNLNSLNIVKNLLPQHSWKPIQFTNFAANMFLIDVRKKIYTASFLGTQELHSRNTGKENACIFPYITG